MSDDAPPHRLYRHYSELPYSMRVLFTCVLLILGLGYLFALLNVYFTYAGRAGGNPLMLSYQDIVVGYSGSGKGSILESALSGPMSTMLRPDERDTLLTWVRGGAPQAAYDSGIKALIDKRCLTCHDGRNPHLRDAFELRRGHEGDRRSTPAPPSRPWCASLTFTFSGSPSSSSSSDLRSPTPMFGRSGSNAQSSRRRFWRSWSTSVHGT